MANEQLTIGQDKARLSVIGKSWPDMNFDSGIGLDLSQIIFDILIDLDIPMPDIDFDDLDDITIIPGLDIDTEIPTLEYPDPDWPDDEIPPIIDWPMPDLDWDDFTDKLEDLDLDPDILTDLSFTGLNDLGIPTLVSLDMDFNIQEDELPASIEIVTPPKKLEYRDGERIDLTGMVVTAKKADGSTWTSAKYPNGHIPLGELIVDPIVIGRDSSKTSKLVVDVNETYDFYPFLQPIVVNSLPWECEVSYQTGNKTWFYYGIDSDDPSAVLVGNYKYYVESTDEVKYIPGGVASNELAVVSKIDYCLANLHYYTRGGIPPTDVPLYRYNLTHQVTYNGKTAYFDLLISGGRLTGVESLDVADGATDYSFQRNRIARYGLLFWYALYGNKKQANSVSLSWERPKDEQILTASFEVYTDFEEAGRGGR